MRADVLSDVHLEFFHRYTDEAFRAYWQRVFAAKTADILFIAGDISSDLGAANDRAAWFFEAARRHWTRVFCVLGNHDYWSHTVPYTETKLAAASLYPEVTFLENETADLGDVQLFGATWWTKVPETEQFFIRQYMQDYAHTPSPEMGPVFSPAVTTLRHEASRAALRKVLEKSQKPVVVMTHHAPSFKSSLWPDARSSLGFCSSDEDLILDFPQLRLWVHGHVHNPSNYVMGAAQIVCRPHGYIDHERSRVEAFRPASVTVQP